ncbi:MAG: hypothetical protein GY708_30695 [Actinomycetia bacterium]|nr:hypothetical protein [Actinomycetes bacterium]MCP4958660.1 hypothetical protein [Actinomycetes bacterium]
MSELQALLRLQTFDTRLDQLIHRRDNLPETERIDELAGSLEAIAGRRVEIATQRHEIERAQKRVEDEVAGIEAKRAEDTDRLYNGGITSPKELTALQDELQSLARHQSTLEDEVLELMEQAEPLDDTLSKFDAKADELEAERGRFEAARTVSLAEIEAEHNAVSADRETAVLSLDEALVVKYQHMRGGAKDGVAVGALTHGVCSACGLGASAVFIDRIRSLGPGEIVNCEECGVILVPAGGA